MNFVLVISLLNVHLMGIGVQQLQSFFDIFQTDPIRGIVFIRDGVEIILTKKVQLTFVRQLNVNINKNIA